ncbi:LOW QUALITY PROTEIN: FYVE, RhoGEF and PH domain-containing protein 6-like [Cottoperca gobio]|uniref:LOW QUALITY PROTEIN: FYVE, RhoGEF and PH domain-containing protein 6-like n=1 Tax=Cottoperca gobio TaxID=56716 RepID=A0A6J2S6M5_COTGO|nr:LOW QUALITY PROTEIN: FYVE, RhoGEF and PH domain-containing protein 6-like [Cottoperca gobio]
MSTGVKKPPLAPKPKIPVTTKPSPPPIAPKPGPFSQPSVTSQPSPATLKRTKPAVAPKPCISKSTASPVSPPLPKPSEPLILSQEQQEALGDSLSLLNSRNGILSETNKRNSDYIISTCSCGLQDCSQCQRLENGNTTENGSDFHKELLQNGISTGGFTEARPQEKAENREEGVAAEKGEGGGIGKKPRDKPQRQRHLERGLVNNEAQRTEKASEAAKHQDCAVSEPDVSKADVQTEAQNTDLTDSAWDVAGSIIISPSISPHESSAESFQVEHSEPISKASPTRLLPDLLVPAAPSKPLPVPHPRKLKKPALVRQDGVEGSAQDQVAEEQKQGLEVREDEGKLSLAGLSLSSDSEELKQDTCDLLHQKDSGSGDDESDAPVPPPRQTSLSLRLHRTVHMRPSLNKSTSHSLVLLSHAYSMTHNKGGEEHRVEEDEEDGYGDFERYPITHSLPKQIKLGCHPPLANARKAFSAEDQQSPRAPPRKPQRHSLPAAPPPPSFCPPAPPHANTPMRELPAPPQEKTAWRFTRPCVTFFSRQIPSRSSVPPKSRAPALGGKQRAQSFSAADLATRSDSHKRSLSFRKLLELRLSVKMLPKLLAKGGQSLDCTSVESNRGGKSLERPNSCIVEADICENGEESVEYENVPLYEEIPEYMNLPFHSARLGWPHDPDGADSELYEVQDPYHRGHDHEYESGWLGQDVHSEEEEIHSSDEEDGSSTSSKEHLDVADRQQEDEMKRKKVVHIAQEIMSSEKVFVDVLKLLHIDFRDAVAKATRQNGKPVVDDRILSQILYYLPQLYQLNRDLLRELEERVAHWSDHQRLSDIFVQKGPYLKMYSTYIRQFDNNVALLDEQCRKNTAFAAVVKEFEMSPRCASLALKHYLLKPVQRIPQYQLLLTDYLKNLPEDSEDYKDTQAALSIVKEVANHANDIMKQGDNFQKLMQIQYSLNGHHEIVQPGRVFLKEGTLMKLSRKVMQPRVFFLFNDALMYTTPVQSGQYKLNSVLSLAGMKVSKPSQEAYQNELNIESVERSFILSASSATERDEWLEAIAKAIDDYTKKKITFISSRSQEEAECVVDTGAPLGSKAPIWIPDLRATMCMMCTCEFTLTWRRHHCRACGRVVCQACSANKYYLEYLKNQPARVCDHCFAKLQENSDRCASTSVSPIKPGAFSFTRKQKKIPAALKEVSANTENSSMSGYLNRSKGNKKQWKRLWFVIKNKVLYTYAASEDVAALESQPLLGFFLREEKNGPAQKLQFKLYHKNTLFYIFKADDIPTAQRWIEAFQEAMILEQ